MFDLYITFFVTLFLIIDPIGLMPMFLALTQDNTKTERRNIALRSIFVAGGILALFGLLGEQLLNAIGIGMPAFRIAGGILLFLTAVDMLFDKRSERRDKHSEGAERPDPSVFPLATPLIAGPGSMAAMILLASEGTDRITSTSLAVLAMLSTLIIAFVLFLISGWLEKILGKTGINVITRLLGMLLAALAVQFVVDGIRGLGVLG